MIVRGQRMKAMRSGFIHRANPKKAGAYVVVHAGLTPKGPLASRFSPRTRHDLLVFRRAPVEKRAPRLLLAGREVLAGLSPRDWK